MLRGSDSWGCIFGHAANNYHKKHTMNADGAQKGRLFQRFLRPALSALLLLHIFAQMAVASTLVLSAPAEMDVSFEGTCWLNFTCSEDALNPFAQLLLPPRIRLLRRLPPHHGRHRFRLPAQHCRPDGRMGPRRCLAGPKASPHKRMGSESPRQRYRPGMD